MLDGRRAILAFSTARFDDPSGRPRELFAALARERQVIFVEDPTAAEPGVPDSWELQFPAPRLLVCRPVLSASDEGPAGPAGPRVAPMLAQLLRWQDVGEFVAWLDAPHALRIARRVGASLVVYDASDAPGARRVGEDGPLVPLDCELARAADLVVAAGPSDEPHRWSRMAARALADLAEAERLPRALRRRRAPRERRGDERPGRRAAEGRR